MSFLVVQRELEGHLVYVSVMEADRDVKNQDVTRVLKAELPFARPMVVGGGASN